MEELLEIDTAEPAHAQIRRHFQQRILRGDLKPGDRIPSTQDLARQWRLSCTAVQKALTSLTAAGMLMRTRRRGTFVSQAGDEAVIGIVIGPSLADESSHYYRVLLQALQEEIAGRRKNRHWTCLAYDGLTPAAQTRPLAEVRPYRQLLRDFGNYSFKGLIEIAAGIHWSEDLRKQTKLPITSHLDANFDSHAFLREALGLVRKSGRKNAAFVRLVTPYDDDAPDGIAECAKQLGVPAPQVVQMFISGDSRQRAETIHQQMLQCLQRWRSGPAVNRPEVLIVGDDIAMRSVALALIETGVQVPNDLLVVSMANEGVHLYYGVPVIRYEFSAREQARRLLDLLWNRILEKPDPVLPILIPGKFAGEP